MRRSGSLVQAPASGLFYVVPDIPVEGVATAFLGVRRESAGVER